MKSGKTEKFSPFLFGGYKILFYICITLNNYTMDLFEHYDTLPKEVIAVLDKYCTGDNDYENCAKLVAELNAIGYTCDYGLDGEPYGLRKLSKFDEWAVEQIEKVFQALLDEMSNVEAEDLKNEVITIEDKICYFIQQEERFENYLN